MSRRLLGDVVSFVRGVTFDGSEVHPAPQAGTVPILRAGNIGQQLETQKDLVWVPGTRISRDQFMRHGDIAICMSSGSPSVVGKSAILDHPFEGSVGAFCGLVRSGPLVHAPYLALWLRSDAFIGWRDGQSRGASIQNLRFSELARLEIDLPSLEKQRRIAEDLSAQLHVVDNARAAAAERGARRERLVEECLANRILTRPDSGWAEAYLRDVVNIQLGKMLSPASKTGTRPVAYLRNANVQWDSFALSEVYEMDFTEAEERKFRLEPGDVLVCEGGQPGRAAIWAGEIERCCYQKALHRLRPIAEAVDPRFLMYRLWLGALRGEFVDNHSATTIAHLPAVRLAGLNVRLPRLQEQRRVAAELREQLATIDAMHVSIQAEREAIEALSAALLRRAFEDLAA